MGNDWTLWLGCLALCGCHLSEGSGDALEGYITPELTVTFPAQAAWVQGVKVSVEGRAKGLHGVTINGEDAQMDGRDFAGEATLDRGIGIIEVWGDDNQGDGYYERVTVLAGAYGDPVTTLAKGIHLRVNESGLLYASGQVESMVDPDDISAQAAGMTVYEDTYGLLGWDAVTIEAKVASLSMGVPGAELDPRDQELELSVVVPDFELTLDTVGEALGLDFDIEVVAWADRVNVDAILDIHAVEGDLVVELTQSTVTVDGFGYDTSLIPFGVEEYLFVESIESFLEEMAVEKIAEIVPPLLDEQLSSLDLSFETELMGQEVAVMAQFAEAGIDRDGVYLGVDVVLSLGDEDQREGLGFLEAPQTLPLLDATSDVVMAVSDDLLNRAMYGLWRSGVMDMTLSTEDDTLDGFVASMLKSEVATIRLEPLLPAVVVEGDAALNVQVGALNVMVETPGGEFGDYLNLTMGAEVPLSVVARDDLLVLEIGEPVLDFVVQDADWGEASTGSITLVLEALLSPEVILAMVGELSFPIPTLGDSVVLDTVEVDLGDGDYHTGVRVNFN